MQEACFVWFKPCPYTFGGGGMSGCLATLAGPQGIAKAKVQLFLNMPCCACAKFCIPGCAACFRLLIGSFLCSGCALVPCFSICCCFDSWLTIVVVNCKFSKNRCNPHHNCDLKLFLYIFLKPGECFTTKFSNFACWNDTVQQVAY